MKEARGGAARGVATQSGSLSIDLSGSANERHGRLRSLCSAATAELVAGVVAALLFGLLAAVIMRDLTDPLDEGLYEWLRQWSSPGLDFAAHALSVLGSEALGVVHVLLLVYLLKKRRFELALGLFVATAGAGFSNGFVKDVFDRERPADVYGLIPPSGGQVFSFPSGHAMVSAAFFFFLAYVTWPLVSPVRRRLIAVSMIVLLVVVGIARVYLGAHYLTDVLGGYLIGFVWADVVILGGYLIGSSWREPSRLGKGSGDSAVRPTGRVPETGSSHPVSGRTHDELSPTTPRRGRARSE